MAFAGTKSAREVLAACTDEVQRQRGLDKFP